MRGIQWFYLASVFQLGAACGGYVDAADENGSPELPATEPNAEVGSPSVNPALPTPFAKLPDSPSVVRENTCAEPLCCRTAPLHNVLTICVWSAADVEAFDACNDDSWFCHIGVCESL